LTLIARFFILPPWLKMAAMRLNEHVHNSTELNSWEGTMSRKILGHRILAGVPAVQQNWHSE
jgi:hypothetical protein